MDSHSAPLPVAKFNRHHSAEIEISRCVCARGGRFRLGSLLAVLGLTGWMFDVRGAVSDHVVFTYQGNPSTTLTVNWQTFGPGSGDASVVYDTVGHDGRIADYGFAAEGETFQVEGLPDRHLHRVELTGLESGVTYHIVPRRAGEDFSKEYKVRTIPADDSPIRFVTGGDMGTSDLMRVLLSEAAKFDPDVALVGGDIAYANGKLSAVGEWDRWLQFYTDEMVTFDGRSIPLVLAIGNHEVDGGFSKPKSAAPFYFNFFGQDSDKSYFSRKFGRNLLFLILDSGHVTSHEEQVPWIRQQLATHSNVKHRAAIYHVPLYPSYRDFMGHHSELGRKYWAPLFDEFELTVAFENHDHTFKRTKLLRNNAIATGGNGTLYLGDGCWGRSPRRIRFEPDWYLDVAGSVPHFWIGDVSSDGISYRAVDADGQVFDVYPASAPGSAKASEVLAGKTHQYILPENTVGLSNLPAGGDWWGGGAVSVTITNSFDHATSFVLSEQNSAGDVKFVGLAGEPIALAPAESVTKWFFVWPRGRAVLPTSDVNIGVAVQARVEAPDFPEALDFQGATGIDVRR